MPARELSPKRQDETDAEYKARRDAYFGQVEEDARKAEEVKKKLWPTRDQSR